MTEPTTSAGIAVTFKHLFGGIVAATLAAITLAFTGWRLYFRSKIKKVDSLSDEIGVLGKTLGVHVEREEKYLKDIHTEVKETRKSVDKVHARVDKVWEHLAANK